VYQGRHHEWLGMQCFLSEDVWVLLKKKKELLTERRSGMKRNAHQALIQVFWQFLSNVDGMMPAVFHELFVPV
jgi:hypothetical protein